MGVRMQTNRDATRGLGKRESLGVSDLRHRRKMKRQCHLSRLGMDTAPIEVWWLPQMPGKHLQGRLLEGCARLLWRLMLGQGLFPRRSELIEGFTPLIEHRRMESKEARCLVKHFRQREPAGQVRRVKLDERAEVGERVVGSLGTQASERLGGGHCREVVCYTFQFGEITGDVWLLDRGGQQPYHVQDALGGIACRNSMCACALLWQLYHD
jgi:hypothetical protein